MQIDETASRKQVSAADQPVGENHEFLAQMEGWIRECALWNSKIVHQAKAIGYGELFGGAR